MKLTARLTHLIEEAIEQLKPEPPGHINHEGILHHALPLFGTLGEVWLLRPDGSMWRADSETGLPFQPLPDDLHVIAIVAGKQRYSWLIDLLPSRPSESIPCKVCGGVGKIGSEGRWFCRACNALGWVAP